MKGERIRIEVNPSGTILNVKTEIAGKEGIPPEVLSLMFAENLLKDDRTLSDYNIPNAITQQEADLNEDIWPQHGCYEPYSSVPRNLVSRFSRTIISL